MPTLDSKKTMVVSCKGCTRCIPAAPETAAPSIAVKCPICLERRAYRVATEVFLGQPHWEIMRALQGMRR